MDKFLNLVLSGSVTGAIYSIMAAGLILTYTTSGMFNFAHGAVAFVTAFFYFELNTGQGIPIVPAVIISVLVFAPLLGLALNYILLRRLAKAPVYAQIVGTIGLLVALPALALWLVETLGNTVLHLDLPSVNVGDAGVNAPGIGPTPAFCSSGTTPSGESMRIRTVLPSSAARSVPLTMMCPISRLPRAATRARFGIQPAEARMAAMSGGICGSSNAASWSASIACASSELSARMRISSRAVIGG